MVCNLNSNFFVLRRLLRRESNSRIFRSSFSCSILFAVHHVINADKPNKPILIRRIKMPNGGARGV